MSFKVKDHYYKKAKQDEYKARSVYKLMEINKKYKIIKRGFKVLDLGAYPGSWSQFILKEVGKGGLVVGIDIQDMKESLGDRYRFLLKSIYDLKPEDFKDLPPAYDVITSDMAPSTTGIKDVDQSASIELCEAAFKLCKDFLKPGGNFVCKIFQSNMVKAFTVDLKKSFKDVQLYKPQGTRKVSTEIFIVCKGLKG